VPEWVDLMGGAGGWDLGAQLAGMPDPLGVEWDADACATRIAAHLPTLEADVAALDPRDHAPTVGLIASPPCQSYSNAGNRAGNRDLALVLGCMADLVAGRDTRAELGQRFADEAPEGALFGFEVEDTRSLLVVEPLRWVLATRPRFVALEQVPGVLPVWEAMGEHFEALGYHVWTGLLRSDEFGVAQTRERAFLIADRERQVAPPKPTHQRWRKGVPRVTGGELLPWVSMAEALGWGLTERPSVTLASVSGGGRRPLDGGSGAREVLRAAQARGEWVESLNTGRDWKPGGDRSSAQQIPLDRPAPAFTVKSGGQWRWQEASGIVATNPRPNATERTMDEPAPTVAGGKLAAPHWTFDRPATTVAGDRRVHPPGHKLNGDDVAAGREYEGRAGKNALTITIDEAAVLQSFPVGFPWQGTQTAQFRQVGNAVPPLMAAAVLAALTQEG